MARKLAPLRVILPNREWIDVRKFGTVKTSLPLADTDDRLLLLFWGQSGEPRFQNVVRVDPHGNVLWRAELPGDAKNDCFVSLERMDSGFVARTFSGRIGHLDLHGRVRHPAPLDA